MDDTFFLDPQPWMQKPQVNRLMAALMADGIEARFIGGCVRDAALFRPVGDVDIATPAPPAEVVRLLDRAGIKTIPTGVEHGTVTAVVDHMPFEITTLRHDVKPDGRWSTVAFITDWKADAARRDLTMNALSCTTKGQIYDPFEGLADARAGRVRFIGDPAARIGEDVLRLLRFFRFYAHYGRGAIDPAGLAACQSMASQLATLSGERVRAETMKLLTAKYPAITWDIMIAHGIMPHLIPDAVHTQPLKHLALLENRLGLCVPLRRLAAALPVQPELAPLIERLCLSNKDKERLTAMTAAGPSVIGLITGGDQRALEHFLRHTGKATAMDRLLLDAAREQIPSADVSRFYIKLLTAAVPVFPLSGQDIVDRGVPPGPAVGHWLKGMTEWWEKHDTLPDRAACLKELDHRLGRVM